MKAIKKKGEAAPTAPTLKIARVTNRANPRYANLPIPSNELAVRLIGERYRLSPAFARTVVELVGYGACA